MFQAKHQGGSKDENAQKIVERFAKPLPLDVIHAPDGPAVQAKILKVENLFADGSSTGVSRKAIRYSRRSQEEDVEEEEDDEEEYEDDEE